MIPYTDVYSHKKHLLYVLRAIHIYLQVYMINGINSLPSSTRSRKRESDPIQTVKSRTSLRRPNKWSAILLVPPPIPILLIPLRYIERINMDSYLSIIVPWPSQFGRSIARLSGGINDIYILRDTGLPPKKFKIYLIGLSRTYYHPIVHIRSTPVFLYIIPK